MSETKWMVDWKWGISDPAFGQVAVERFTAKRAYLKRSESCSGYRTQVNLDELFDTKAQAAESIRDRALECASYLRKVADAIESSIEEALK